MSAGSKSESNQMAAEIMVEDVLEIVEVFQVAAFELRRLGRGPLRKDFHSVNFKNVYRFDDQVRLVHSFPHDVCFETANKLEEFAGTLERWVKAEICES